MHKSRSVVLAPYSWIASALAVLAVGSRADSAVSGSGGSERADGARVQECGDGTMIDRETGYHWEMKHASDGVADLSNPHDVDNEYTWTSLKDGNAENPDGTLFAVFLKKLNEADDATESCFAGHCDWRLPTKDELLSIRHARCRRPPCIDAEFGPNAGGPVAAVRYWTGETVEGRPNFAWAVKFFAGRPNNTQKKFPLYARAIRRGSCP